MPSPVHCHYAPPGGEFDQHEIWSPFCLSANGRFYLFYTGVRHPVRPMCRDPHVVYEPEGRRWLLYSTGRSRDGFCEEYVSTSCDLVNWQTIGVCARFPQDGFPYSTTESMTVMKHPLSGRWILMGNWHYALSDNPEDFTMSPVRRYFDNLPEQSALFGALGFAGETVEWNGAWYRSGVLGVMDHWVLGFHKIAWDPDGAFRIEEPSRVKWQF